MILHIQEHELQDFKSQLLFLRYIQIESKFVFFANIINIVVSKEK